jgi:hypothetical protein
MDRNASNVFLKLNGFRGIQSVTLSPQMMWEPFFSNLNPDSDICISITNDQEKQTVLLSKDKTYTFSSTHEADLSTGQILGTPLANSYALKLNYRDKKTCGGSTFCSGRNRYHFRKATGGYCQHTVYSLP